MSLSSGEITTIDLSPNANIQGTQIADNTIQFRNLAGNVFKVIASNTISLVQSPITGTAGIYTGLFNQATTPHGLSYTPGIQSYLVLGGNFIPMPYTAINSINSSSMAWVTYYIATDATNLYFNYQGNIFGGGTLAGTTLKAQYYLLQVSAS
jgi:hypothetical protein